MTQAAPKQSRSGPSNDSEKSRIGLRRAIAHAIAGWHGESGRHLSGFPRSAERCRPLHPRDLLG